MRLRWPKKFPITHFTFIGNKSDSGQLSTVNATKTFGGLDDGEEQKSYRSEIAGS
jgi:hypothetical protein